jgi:hypothetical protein
MCFNKQLWCTLNMHETCRRAYTVDIVPAQVVCIVHSIH